MPRGGPFLFLTRVLLPDRPSTSHALRPVMTTLPSTRVSFHRNYDCHVCVTRTLLYHRLSFVLTLFASPTGSDHERGDVVNCVQFLNFSVRARSNRSSTKDYPFTPFTLFLPDICAVPRKNPPQRWEQGSATLGLIIPLGNKRI